MDPVTQTLAQQQSGSAGGQGFGQFFVAGRQDARQGQQLNLARRAEDRLAERQRTLLPYEEAVMGLQVINAGQTAHFNRMKLANQVEQNHALPEIMALESYFMRAPKGFRDELGQQKLQQLRDHYPRAFVEGTPGDELFKLTMMPQVMDWKAQQMEQATQRHMQGTGRFVQQMDARGNPVLGEINQRTTAIPDKLEIADRMDLYQSVIASPNATPEQKAQAERLLGNINAQLGTSSMELLDEQGNVRVRQTTGRQPAATDGLTSTLRTKVQTSIQEARKAIVALDDLDVRARDVGIQGVLGELADDFGPQFGLTNADLQRMDTRTKIRAFVESAKRTVTDDDRFTEGDRAAVKAITISEGVRENEQTAAQTKATLKQLFGVRTLIEAKTLGQPAPLWAMHALTQKRLLEAIEDGLLTDPDIMNAFDAGLINENQAVAAREKRTRKQ